MLVFKNLVGAHVSFWASDMKSKGRSSLLRVKLSLPVVVLLCLAFFFTGYYTFYLTPASPDFQNGAFSAHLKLLEVDGCGAGEHGESGDGVVHTIPFQILSWHPRALLFPKFATPEQCERIIVVARKRLSPSGLALRKGETADNTKDIRTSSGTFVTSNQDKSGTLAAIEEKMSRATMIPRHHGEAFNVLRYELGQKYNSHYDVFDPVEYGPQRSQRMASFLLYLSDVEEGGETMFPFENFRNMDSGYDYKECIGLKIKPKQGDALLFYSMQPNGTFDKTALHGSCPVMKGEKWVATKWIRDTAGF